MTRLTASQDVQRPFLWWSRRIFGREENPAERVRENQTRRKGRRVAAGTKMCRAWRLTAIWELQWKSVSVATRWEFFCHIKTVQPEQVTLVKVESTLQNPCGRALTPRWIRHSLVCVCVLAFPGYWYSFDPNKPQIHFIATIILTIINMLLCVCFLFAVVCCVCWPPLHASDNCSKALRHLEIASVGKLRKCWVQKDKFDQLHHPAVPEREPFICFCPFFGEEQNAGEYESASGSTLE